MGASLGDTTKLHKRVEGAPVDEALEAPAELNESAYDHMVACILDPTKPRVSEAKDCLEVARVLDAIKISAANDEEVFVE
jgi:hypothetical protein